MKQKLFMLGLFSSVYGFSQQAVVSSGGDASGSGGTVSYSIGQVAYSTNASGAATGSETQGVQQPFEIFVISGLTDLYPSISATLFPNPAQTSVILSMDGSRENAVFQLTDIGGKLIRSGNIIAKETSIDIQGLAEACYHLNVLVSQEVVKTFKLIKTDN
jgi:Secretion system C-terminal sorting domain